MTDDINYEGIEQLKELMGDKYPQLVETYLKSSAQNIEKIRQGLADGNAEMIRDSAHPMKSSSGNMGLTSVCEAAEELEKQAKAVVSGEGSTGDLPTLVEKIVTLYEEGTKILKAKAL